ncbi:MAG: hypothetical protein ACLSWV_09915, partial [Pygmaiobacter massiliensis]
SLTVLLYRQYCAFPDVGQGQPILLHKTTTVTDPLRMDKFLVSSAICWPGTFSEIHRQLCTVAYLLNSPLCGKI